MPMYFENGYNSASAPYSQQPPMQSPAPSQGYYPYQSGYSNGYSPLLPQRPSTNLPTQMYGQNPLMQAQQPSGQQVHITPVTCREEAIASPIPLDGSITYFPDRAHKMVYSKQFNLNDGSAIIHEYYEDSVVNAQNKQQTEQKAAEQQDETKSIKGIAYVEKSEFEAVQARVKELEEKLQSLSASAKENQRKQKEDK